MFVFYLIATKDLHSALVAVLSGGLLFGAVFMATDYVTSPFTLKGKLVYGVCLASLPLLSATGAATPRACPSHCCS